MRWQDRSRDGSVDREDLLPEEVLAERLRVGPEVEKERVRFTEGVFWVDLLGFRRVDPYIESLTIVRPKGEPTYEGFDTHRNRLGVL